LVASFALVFWLLCGTAEPLDATFQNQSGVSPQCDGVVAPSPVTALSLSRPAKLKAGTSSRKNRTQALAPDKSVGTGLQSSGFLPVTCNGRSFAADVTVGFGRSPPSFSLI